MHRLDFNPRPREEGDVFLRYGKIKKVYFNPRPREEGDFYKAELIDLTTSISIHALVKRATWNNRPQYRV